MRVSHMIYSGCDPSNPLAWHGQTSADNLGAPVDYINLIQWPAKVVTVVAAWLVASQHKRRREVGFW